jgi:hypothetical protein
MNHACRCRGGGVKDKTERRAARAEGALNPGLGPPGSSDNWRCIAVEKLTAIEALDEPWQTAPNHSRPTSCIVDPYTARPRFRLMAGNGQPV